MLFNIEFMETKGEGWKVATLKDVHGAVYSDVSINKVDKKTGEVAFPTFDELMTGHTINGNVWTSPTGRTYLFAEKPAAPASSGGRPGGAGIKAAQERKAEGIREAQENRAHGVKIAAAFRDATLLTIELMKNDELPDREAMLKMHREMREWYLKEWDAAEKALDIPFKEGEGADIH